MGVLCPKCGCDTRIVDSRSFEGINEQRRIRKCQVCGYEFKTVERIVGSVKQYKERSKKK